MERDTVLAALRAEQLAAWSNPASPVSLGAVNWTPDFVLGSNVAALVLNGEIPSFLRRRLEAASESGLQVCCVCDLASITAPGNLEFLSKINAQVLRLGDDASSKIFLPLLKFLGVEQIPVEAAVRSALVRDGLAACAAASTNDLKGKTLEWLLHFMLSQVADFRIVACNYRTSTEELDAVVQLRTFDPRRCWAHWRAPIIVFEAKNRKQRQGQEVVSKLNTIMETKHGNCRLGFIVSLSGFTSDAHDQVLKLAMKEQNFVLLNGADLQRWADQSDFEEALNEIVLKAMLP